MGTVTIIRSDVRLAIPPVEFPTIVHAPKEASASTLHALITHQRESFSRQLARAGALLFRGFGVSTAAELSRLMRAAGGEPMRYVGGDSPRTDMGGDVYTSTELPRSFRIPLHNEMSFLNIQPRHLWLACVTPARSGGETLIADGRAIWRELAPSVDPRFIEHGVRYRCSYRGESRFWDAVDRIRKVSKTWMEAFETNDRRIVDERCRDLATRHHWLRSGRLVMEIERPAIVRHPGTGEVAWFNQVNLFRLNPYHLGYLNYLLSRIAFIRPDTRTHHAQFRDGSEIARATLAQLFDVITAHTVAVKWQAGDVLWLDNISCMHGRNSFRGARRVLVTMSR